MSDEKNADVAEVKKPKSDEAVQPAKEESQPSEKSVDAEVEDPSVAADAAEIVASVEKKPKEEPKPDESKEVPFNDHPRWKEVTGKLGDETKRADANQQSADYWQAFNQYSAKNPEAAIGFIQDLEDKGMVEKGTVERAKQQLSTTQEPGSEQAPSQSGEEDTSKFREFLNQDPTYREVDTQRREREQQTEQVFQEFEKSHPDVPEAASADPTIRRRIFMEADAAVKAGKPMNEALDDAYKWVMKRDEVLAEARETGEVEGLVSGIQQGVGAGTSDTGTSRSSKKVSLTDSEKAMAKSFDMSDEEYARYKEDPDGSMTEDLNK